MDQTDEAEVGRAKYLNNWIAKYEKASRSTRMSHSGVDEKYTRSMFPIGKDILNDEPENIGVILDLVDSRALRPTIPRLMLTPSPYAKKSHPVARIRQSTREVGARFHSKDDALGLWQLHYRHKVRKQLAPAKLSRYLIKAASYEARLRSCPYTYAFLGEAYEKGPFAETARQTYKAKYEGKEETTESKLAIENINQIVDRMIDAYARAVALSGTDPQYKDIKAQALGGATDWYKFRHEKQTTGLDEMIASVYRSRLPPEPTPITTLPTPAATPASGSGTSAAGGRRVVAGEDSWAKALDGAITNPRLPLGRTASTPDVQSTISTGHPAFVRINPALKNNEERSPGLDDLETILQYEFGDRALLERAITHRSWAHEQMAPGAEEARRLHNEALEFLGDSVLGLAVADKLCRAYPSSTEGELSRMKHRLVSAPTLAIASLRLNLGDFLRFGRGEEKSGGRRKDALLADVFEAVTGAIFLDGGLGSGRGVYRTSAA